MNRNKMITAVAVATVACGMFAGCAPRSTDAVIRIENNGKKDSLDYGYVNFVCRMNQARVDQANLANMGMGYWSQTAQTGSNETNEDSAKDYIYQNIQGQYLARQHAADLGVKVTASDKKKIKKAAADFMKDNTKKAIDQVGAKEEYIEDFLEYETYYERVRAKVESSADDTVSDSEAKQSTFTYALFSTKSDSKSASGDSSISKEDKEKLLAKAKKVASASDFDKEAKKLKAETSTYSFTRAEDPGSDQAMDEKVITEAKKLADGQVSGVIEVKDKGYYVIRMDKTYDEAATKTKRKSLAEQKREEAFSKQMTSWKKKVKFTLNKKLWKQIKFTDLFTTKQTKNSDTGK